MVVLPLFILFGLLLFGLVPICEDDFSCYMVNNYNKSLVPMLRFIDGQPPV